MGPFCFSFLVNLSFIKRDVFQYFCQQRGWHSPSPHVRSPTGWQPPSSPLSPARQFIYLFFWTKKWKKKKNGANLPAVFYSKSCKYGKLTFAVIWSQFYSALCLNVSIPRTSQRHECKAWMSHWRTDFIVSCKWRVWECSLCVFKCSLVRPGLIMSDVLWVLCGHVSSAEWCIRHGEVTRYFCQ